MHDLKLEPPELRMTMSIQKHFPNVVEAPNAVRWSALDMAAVLAFSSNAVIIAIRGHGSVAPVFCKCLLFEHIVDVQFLPFAGNYLALLTEDATVHIIDWQAVHAQITANEDKATLQVNDGIDQIHVCGLYINERTIKMGEYNHLLMISKTNLTLLDVSLDDKISLKEINSISLATSEDNESLLTHFDICYGLLYILEANTGKLSIYQYKPNTHSFEEFYMKIIELTGKATGLSAVMEGFGRLGSNIRIIVADTQGVKFCRVSVNKVLPRVDEKILNLEVFRPKVNAEIPAPDLAVPSASVPKASEEKSIPQGIPNFGMPPGLLTGPRPELISLKVADIFSFDSELADNPSPFQESLPIVEERVRVPTEEEKQIPPVVKDEEINEKLARLMSFGKDDIDSEDKTDILESNVLPQERREEIIIQPKVVEEQKIDVEEIKSVIRNSMMDVVKNQVGAMIIPAMENSLKKIMTEIRADATEDATKFLKQRELEYAKMDSICSLYEINMQKIAGQQKEYTNMVLKILKDKQRVTKAPEVRETIPVIPTIQSEPIRSLFIPEISEASEGKSVIKEGIWSYTSTPEVRNPYQMNQPRGYGSQSATFEQPYTYYETPNFSQLQNPFEPQIPEQPVH